MKLTKILIMTTIAASAASCSIFSPKGKTVDGSSASAVQSGTAATTGNKAGANLPDLIAGEWVIISADGKPIGSVDDMPYVTFDKSSGRFYASDGCNVINGSYAVTSDGKLTLDNVLSTLKMCDGIEYEAAISSALSGAQPLSVKYSQLGHESFLSFTDAKGSEMIKARKHNMDFLNGNWQITSVNGKATEGDEATIFIDINELKVHGNTGCNFFNGQLFINPDKSNAIDFSDLASTRMMCPNMEQESAILLALEETVSAIQGNEGQVMLLNNKGKELMTLKSIPTDKQ